MAVLYCQMSCIDQQIVDSKAVDTICLALTNSLVTAQSSHPHPTITPTPYHHSHTLPHIYHHLPSLPSHPPTHSSIVYSLIVFIIAMDSRHPHRNHGYRNRDRPEPNRSRDKRTRTQHSPEPDRRPKPQHSPPRNISRPHQPHQSHQPQRPRYVQPLEINRKETPPFLCNIYYSLNTENSIGAMSDLPADRHLTLYLWMDSSLKEITELIRAHLPALRTKQRFVLSRVHTVQGALQKKEMGVVMVHKKGSDRESARLDQSQFSIGDSIDVAIYYK